MSEMPEKVALYSVDGGPMQFMVFDICPPIGATHYAEYTRSDIHAKLEQENAALKDECVGHLAAILKIEIANAKLKAKLEEAKGLMKAMYECLGQVHGGWMLTISDKDFAAIRHWLEGQ